jgi:3-hydroxyacyl-CoA dehydrogenase
MQTIHDEFADSKYRPCPLLKEMVAAGYLGRKTGRASTAMDVSMPWLTATHRV